MLERDPNGTKTKINECIGSNKEINSIVNEIIQRRELDSESDEEKPRKVYTKKDLKKFRAAGHTDAGVGDIALATTDKTQAKTSLPDFNPADLGYPVKTVPLKLNKNNISKSFSGNLKYKMLTVPKTIQTDNFVLTANGQKSIP